MLVDECFVVVEALVELVFSVVECVDECDALELRVDECVTGETGLELVRLALVV